MKKAYLIDSLKLLDEKITVYHKYINKPNIKEFSKVSIGAFLYLLFSLSFLGMSVIEAKKTE